MYAEGKRIAAAVRKDPRSVANRRGRAHLYAPRESQPDTGAARGCHQLSVRPGRLLSHFEGRRSGYHHRSEFIDGERYATDFPCFMSWETILATLGVKRLGEILLPFGIRLCEPTLIKRGTSVAAGVADILVASGQSSLNVRGEKIELVLHFVPARSSNICRAERPAQNEPYRTQCAAPSTNRDDIKKGKKPCPTLLRPREARRPHNGSPPKSLN